MAIEGEDRLVFSTSNKDNHTKNKLLFLVLIQYIFAISV